MTTLTRKELYDLVWSEPIRTIAAAHGVSDVWMKKVCGSANIPTPERGYWAKHAAGKPVVKIRLPPRGLGMPDAVSIGRSVSNWRYDPEAELPEPIPNPPVFDEPLEDVRARVVKMVGKVARCRDLSDRYPMVRRLLDDDERRRQKQRASAFAIPWDAPLFDSPFEARRLRILNALGLALPKIGAKISHSGKEARKLTLHVGTQNIEFVLDHPSATPSRWGEWSTRPGPVDTLRLELKPRFEEDVPKRVWIDGEEGKLEDQLTEMVVAFGVAGEAQYRQGRLAHHAYLLKRRVENQTEVARRRAEAERQAQERRMKVAQERRDRLFGQARDWRIAEDIRGFVDQVLASRPASADALAEWAEWARREADAIDPVRNGRLVTGDHDKGEESA